MKPGHRHSEFLTFLEQIYRVSRPNARPAVCTGRIVGWNDRAHPFSWTKTPDDVLKKTSRQRNSSAGR